MKYKMLASIVALTVVTWAQTSNSNPTSATQPSTSPAEKSRRACCDQMAVAGAKQAHFCCAHHDMNDKDSKEKASCCAEKDAKSSDSKHAMSCMKNGKDASAASCCKEGCSKESCGKDKTAATCCDGSCGKDGEKGCCSTKKTEKTAKNCCAGNLLSKSEWTHYFGVTGR